MGRGRIAFIVAVIAGVTLFGSGLAHAEESPSISSYLSDPVLDVLLPHQNRLHPLIPVTQDVITEAEYNRLTGIRKRVGVSVYGGFALMGGNDAGAFRVNYANTTTTSVKYRDLFNIEGTMFGIEVSLIVAPCYSVHLGGSFLYHQGKPYENNSFTDLYRYPFYLGLRLNAPLALSFDRWLDFESPEYVTGLLPFIKVKLVGTWWSRVEVSGTALPYYESSRDYFVQGLYPEAYGGGGIEFRVGSIALFGEVGVTYQLFAPRMSKYFSRDPTSPDEIVPGLPFEFTFQGGITYYFGSGRIFQVMPDAD
ncbi:MAG: hypothetical protein ACYTHN_09030 [Planctomycetota bacterium]|jgi:hypothetical protein